MSENGRYFHIAIFQIVPLDSLMQRLYWFVLLLGLVMTTNSKEIIEGEDAQGSLAVNESILFELSTIVDWKYLVFTVNVTLQTIILIVMDRGNLKEGINVAGMVMNCSDTTKQMQLVCD